MTTFLERVAQDIICKFGTDLSRTVVVFPNKRASLFLNDALARQADMPLWAPGYITISELFRQQSDLQIADPIKLVCELYRVYTDITGFEETLDHFYGWGELLLSDFDDVDKNMAPAQKVFANLRDIHELDTVSYLSDEQREMLKKFFSCFTDDHDSLLKERFLRLWTNMNSIYEHFRQRLISQGLAYEGLLYRQVIDGMEASEATDAISTPQPDSRPTPARFPADRYIFVGFNLLHQVEKRLFMALQQQRKAVFYWDFDQYYLRHEAGHFIHQHLERFPNELPPDDAIYHGFSRPKDLTFVSATTEDAQARYLSRWITAERAADGRRTAVVLCNEGLLQTVVHCLPESVSSVNITTGYPLQQTPICSFLVKLFNLATKGYDKQRQRYRFHQVSAVRRHPYARYIDDSLLLVQPTGGNAQLLQWLTDIVTCLAKSADFKAANTRSGNAPFTDESFFRAYTLLNRLNSLVQEGDLEVDATTLQRLLQQLLQQATIPFHGEPAEGLQVMGVLETRNIDFSHVILLSCNEGYMPRGVSDTSFIPYSIRRAFGLTTIEHKVAIYAYYFHRLLSRADDVTLVYNTAPAQGKSGEMSRFMLQLLAESPHPIRHLSLKAGQHTDMPATSTFEKDGRTMEKLRRRFLIAEGTLPTRPLLTPTAINHYMRCPLQFYYCYVEGLREPEQPDDEQIDNRIFGNIFHTAAQLLYQTITAQDRRITNARLEQTLRHPADIERAVDAAIKQELNNVKELTELNGLQIISREVIIHYLRLLLKQDQKLAPFTIIQLEADVQKTMPLPALGGNTTIGGRIDRLDLITTPDSRQQIRVIDYKTSSKLTRSLAHVDAIFDPKQLSNHSDYFLQTLLYARIVKQQLTDPTTDVAPALLFIQHTAAQDSPILCFDKVPINDVATPDGDRFEELLNAKINEIFSPDLPFVPTDDTKQCETCPYRLLCNKLSAPARSRV